MTNKLTVYGGEILSVQGKKQCVVWFEIEAPAAVPGEKPLALWAPMMCDVNYRDAILKALRRLKSVPAAALPASAIQEADGAS